MTTEHDPITCVFSVDDAYCQHFAVALTSLAVNTPGRRLSVHVIHYGVSDKNISSLKDYIATIPLIELELHYFNPTKYNFSISRYITTAAYFRFFLPDILPLSVKRAIYLDSDLVVLKDISLLWALDLEGNAVGAAPDPCVNKPGFLYNYGQKSRTMNEQLGLNPEYKYFNSGVLLVDIEKWRSTDVKQRLIDYALNNIDIMLYHDQDALNVVLHSEVLSIGYEWNFQALTKLSDAAYIGIGESALDHIKTSPAIVHYAGTNKPWKFRRRVPFGREYYRYLRMTPWRSYVPPDRNLKGYAGRYLSPVRDFFRRMARRAAQNAADASKA